MTKHNTTLYNQIYVTFNKIFVTFMTDAFSIKLLMWNSENFKVVQPVQTCRESFFFVEFRIQIKLARRRFYGCLLFLQQKALFLRGHTYSGAPL